MSRVVRASSGSQTAVFGSIDSVASVERQRMFGPDPESVEVQVARYQANEEARRLIAEAYTLAETIREDAYRSGHESGWADGFAAGRTEAERQVHEETEQFRAEYREEFARLLCHIEEQTRSQWMNAEAQMVALVLEIARKVVKHEAAVNPDIIVEVVKNALRRHIIVGEGENVRIRVNAADLENVRAARQDILTVIDTVRSVEVIEDRRVSRGGCVVETASGSIDAQVETQFRSIEETLHAVREETLARMRDIGDLGQDAPPALQMPVGETAE